MAITFREAVAEVELGLVSSDQLPDVATAGLLEGYESAALAALASRFGEPCDPVEIERLWSDALQELEMPLEGCLAAGRVVVRAYARLVAEGDVPPQLGASRIAGVHRITARPGCDERRLGDCLHAAAIIALFNADGGRGYLNNAERARLEAAIVDECRRLAECPGG
jgi:hypothetical protein